jgi:succinyl-CoA synthetase beta subunit
VVIASTEGGMDIEAVAASTPEKILKETADPAMGLMPFQARRLCKALGLTEDLAASGAKIIHNVYRLFGECDCSLVEVNPLAVVIGPDGRPCVQAVDAKINFDDNGLFRHKDLAALRDINEEDPREVEASKFELNYIGLDGNIGCMVNGAGLAMATMDIIKHYGGTPANFLDVGGGANVEQVTEAFKLLCSDKNVKALLVNIFGGIMRCDVIAQGIVAAAKAVHIPVPLVVRLEGTNVELGRKQLKESGLPIITATSMADAAQKVVRAARS